MSTPTPLAPDFPEIDPGFHHVLRSMPGVVYVEAEGLDGPTVYMSPRIEGLTGHAPERFLDSRDFWFTLVHPDDRARVQTAEAAATMESSYLEEYRMVAADGRVLWVRDEEIGRAHV